MAEPAAARQQSRLHVGRACQRRGDDRACDHRGTNGPGVIARPIHIDDYDLACPWALVATSAPLGRMGPEGAWARRAPPPESPQIEDPWISLRFASFRAPGSTPTPSTPLRASPRFGECNFIRSHVPAEALPAGLRDSYNQCSSLGREHPAQWQETQALNNAPNTASSGPRVPVPSTPGRPIRILGDIFTRLCN